jgi:LysM repeat protein
MLTEKEAAMDDEDFDQRSSRNVDYLDDPPGVVRRPRRDHGRSGLLGRQMVFIVVANAVISAIISLVMVRCAAPSPVIVEPEPLVVTATTVARAEGPEVGAATPTEAAAPTTPTAVPTPVVDSVVPSTEATPGGRPAEPTTYIVQPGDTLSTIAGKFEVSQEDLMRANGIDNPDYLMLGQKLVIPIGGMPIVTTTFTPPPSPAASETPIAFEPPTPLPPGVTPPQVPAAALVPTPTAVPTLTPVPASDIRLTLEVLSPGDPVKEVVYIVNRGLYVRLAGWTLSNGRGATYTFPDLGLGGNGAAINVHTGSGTNTASDLFWGRSATAWETGDMATLQDAAGKVIVTSPVSTPTPESP